MNDRQLPADGRDRLVDDSLAAQLEAIDDAVAEGHLSNSNSDPRLAQAEDLLQMIDRVRRQRTEDDASSVISDEVCGADRGLRQMVEQFLTSRHDAAKHSDDPPGTALGMTEQAGAVIGPYKLLQKIGEGGFGVIFMAEQTKPVRRRVALKIIKAGMDTKEVIARFEAERQALALMDHPNIAQVFDAGATDSGRPFFVMELVRGVPLTEFCDSNHLSARERLKLFVMVCRAVQHAHQKGIIHRDLKPSNVMVTLYDNKPVPKVIDFGVAKAISQQLTEKTM